MKKQDVQVGANYIAKVSGKLAEVRITGESRFGGWDAVNVATKKTVRIKSAQRLRAAAGKPKVDPKAQAAADRESARLDAERKASDDGMTASERALAAAAAKRNPLANATGSDFGDALNKATAEQLSDALNLQCWSTKQRGRIEAAIKTRRGLANPPERACPKCGSANLTFDKRGFACVKCGHKQEADDMAKTVEAVEKGDLTKGIEIPTAGEKKPAAKAAKPEGKMSGLDAAAKVLAESPEPMNAKQIVEAMAAKGYWSSTAATPHATIYAAMTVEIAKKGDQARFRKTDRGLFTVTDAGKQAK